MTLFAFGCFFWMSKNPNLEKPCHSNPKMFPETKPPTVGGGSSRRTYLGCVDEDGTLTAVVLGQECLRNIEYIIRKQCLDHREREREIFFKYLLAVFTSSVFLTSVCHAF